MQFMLIPMYQARSGAARQHLYSCPIVHVSCGCCEILQANEKTCNFPVKVWLDVKAPSYGEYANRQSPSEVSRGLAAGDFGRCGQGKACALVQLASKLDEAFQPNTSRQRVIFE